MNNEHEALILSSNCSYFTILLEMQISRDKVCCFGRILNSKASFSTSLHGKAINFFLIFAKL